MNYKILGLLALAVTALVALPAVAQATTVTSPTGTTITGEKEGKSEGHVVLHNSFSKIECKSELNGPIETHGSGVTAGGKVKTLSFTGCTNSWHVTTVAGGTLEAHFTSGYNATITSSGTTITSTRLGVTCNYVTNNTHFGTATGGNPATLHVEARIPIHTGSSGLCGTEPVQLTGSYEGAGSAYYDA